MKSNNNPHIEYKLAISVVMACKNEEKYLGQAMDSIISQTFKNYEFIIINDGSTDRTESIIREYMNIDSRIKLLINNESKGLTRCLIDAISNAKGEYIARQDADDISLPDRLEKQVIFLNGNLDCSVLGACIETIDENGSPVDVKVPITGKRNVDKHLRYGNILAHGSVMFRKEEYEKVGGYNSKFIVAQDYDLWLRMSKNARIDNLPNVLYRWRINKESISAKRKDRQVANVLLAIINNYSDNKNVNIEKTNRLSDSEALEYIVNYSRKLNSMIMNETLGISMLRMGYTKQARKLLLRTGGVKYKILSALLFNDKLFGFFKYIYIRVNNITT